MTTGPQKTATPRVKRILTVKRRTRPVVENTDYAALSRRVLRAQARRISVGDVEGLNDLLALERELQRAIHSAVTGLRTSGYSWGEIATRIGIGRQAAHQRWGPPTTGPKGQACHDQP
jgi:hypothetical protein